MKDELEKIRLADRTEAILRSDRHALQLTQREAEGPAVLLTLVPDIPIIIDFMDAYIGELAERVGLQYVRLVAPDTREVPANYLSRTRLVLADLTGRDEDVVTLLYQTFGSGRRILMSAQGEHDIPPDLAEVPSVFYQLESGDFDPLLREVQQRAVSTKQLSRI